MELLIGFISGSVFTMWLFFLIGREEKWAKRPEAAAFKDFEEKKDDKPDLAKVKYYQSAAYKNQKAFCERMKRGELE